MTENYGTGCCQTFDTLEEAVAHYCAEMAGHKNKLIQWRATPELISHVDYKTGQTKHAIFSRFAATSSTDNATLTSATLR